MISHFQVLKIFLLYGGAWPEQPKNKILRKIYICYGYISQVFVFCFVLTLVGRMVETIVLSKWTDFPGALNVAMLYSNSWVRVSIYKMEKRRKLFLLLLKNERLLWKIDNKEIRKMLRASAVSSNSYYYICVCSVCMTLFVFGYTYNVIRLADAPEGTTYPLPFDAYVPWAARTNYRQYWVTVLIIFGIMGTNLGVYFVSAQLYLINIFTYVSTEIKVLQYYMKNIWTLATVEMKNIDVEMFDKYLNNWIVRHNYIIKYMDDFNKLFNLVLLMDCSTLSLQLANNILHLGKENERVKLAFECAELVAVCCQIFLMYTKADQIIVQSLKLSETIYDSNWENMPEKIKHKMRFIIMRTQKPLKVYIGPFAVMSNELMMKIFRGVYTILAAYNTTSK